MDTIVITLDFIEFPPCYTCEGENLSPPIHIKGLRAKSLAIIAVNPFQPSCCSFCPWLIWNIDPHPYIPPGIPGDAVVTHPVRAIQGLNDAGRIGYTGPCPPPGATHRYAFRVYGLDTMLDIEPGSRKADLITAMRGHVEQYGETIAMYSRPPGIPARR